MESSVIAVDRQLACLQSDLIVQVLRCNRQCRECVLNSPVSIVECKFAADFRGRV